MSNANKIIWFEGMFLEPQHFQQHERYIENLIQQKHRFIENNFWGFSQLTLDLDLLSIGKIGIQSAQGIFQDGTAFTIPELDHQPDPYQISEGMCNTTLYLCVPLTQQSAEVGSTESTELYRYRIKYQEIADYLVESDHKTEIQLGTLATKILSEHEDRSAYCCLPITRINETQPNHGVFFEKEFLTSYVDVHESKQLRYLIAEFHGLLNHRAEMLANRLTDAKQAGTAEMIDFLLLQLFNRYELIFHYLNDKKPLHPEKLYYILIQLIGELATFTQTKRRPNEIPIYCHENLSATFQPIISELREALIKVLQQNAITIPLQDQGHGLWVGKLVVKELIQTCQFILAVYAELPLEHIKTSFPLQVKIAPVEQIQTLISRSLPGINMETLTVAPRQIPYHANFSYFILNTKDELWKQLEKSAGIALHVGNVFPGLKLELWAIKDN